jgi:hypothetical protein
MSNGHEATVAERLQALGAPDILVQMANNGQILELKSEMPTSHCDQPNGETHFDPWPEPRSTPENRWSPNAHHYPTRKMDRGKLKPWQCDSLTSSANVMDVGWRTRIRTMLETPTMSFEQIAGALNKRSPFIYR